MNYNFLKIGQSMPQVGYEDVVNKTSGSVSWPNSNIFINDQNYTIKHYKAENTPLEDWKKYNRWRYYDRYGISFVEGLTSKEFDAQAKEKKYESGLYVVLEKDNEGEEVGTLFYWDKYVEVKKDNGTKEVVGQSYKIASGSSFITDLPIVVTDTSVIVGQADKLLNLIGNGKRPSYNGNELVVGDDLNNYATKDEIGDIGAVLEYKNGILYLKDNDGNVLSSVALDQLAAGVTSLNGLIGDIVVQFEMKNKNLSLKASDGTILATVLIDAAAVGALPDTTLYGASLGLSGSSLLLKDQNGSQLNSINLETVINSALTDRIATTTQLGMVKSATTGTTADRDYNVEVNDDGTMKVNVPWVDTDTTYGATGGIELADGKFKHTNSITARTSYLGSSTSLPRFTYDSQGHITGTSTVTIYPPTSVGSAYQYWRSDGSGTGRWQSPYEYASNNSDVLITSGGVYAELQKYVPNTRTINGKPLSSNIVLEAEDLGNFSLYEAQITTDSNTGAETVKLVKPGYFNSSKTYYYVEVITNSDGTESYNLIRLPKYLEFYEIEIIPENFDNVVKALDGCVGSYRVLAADGITEYTITTNDGFLVLSRTDIDAANLAKTEEIYKITNSAVSGIKVASTAAATTIENIDVTDKQFYLYYCHEDKVV